MSSSHHQYEDVVDGFGRTIIPITKDRRAGDNGGDTRHNDNHPTITHVNNNSNIDNPDYQDRRNYNPSGSNNNYPNSDNRRNYPNFDPHDRRNYNQQGRSYPRDNNDPPSYKRDRGDFLGPSSGSYHQNDQNKFPRGQYNNNYSNNNFNSSRESNRDSRRESGDDGWHGPQYDSGDKNYRPNFRKGPPSRYDSRHDGGGGDYPPPEGHNIPPPPSYKMGSHGDPSKSPVMMSPPKRPIDRLYPLMSFKSFMQTQNDDLSPEAFQRMYEQYNLRYIQDFTTACFKTNLLEEWFQDRYNPARIVAVEDEISSWAVKESLFMKTSLLEHPNEVVAAMCLDPPEYMGITSPSSRWAYPIDSTDGVNNSKDASSHESSERPLTTTTAEDGDDAVAAAGTLTDNLEPVKVYGKHLAGHEDRCLIIHGVPAICPKYILRNAIIDAITSSNQQVQGEDQNGGGGSLQPERIVISQPVSSLVKQDKFDRTAWVIMPSIAAARRVMSLLNYLNIDIPVPISTNLDGITRTLLTFSIKAHMHNSQVMFNKNQHASHYLRVQSDTVKALELATLLDEEKKVPEESRLTSILESEVIVNALVKPTDRLDLAIAYLRRVHFFSFYGGRKYRDESHLLGFCPSVIHRSKGYVFAPKLDQSSSISNNQQQGLLQVKTTLSPPNALEDGSALETVDGSGDEVRDVSTDANDADAVAPVAEDLALNADVEISRDEEETILVVDDKEQESGKKRKIDDTDIDNDAIFKPIPETTGLDEAADDYVDTNQEQVDHDDTDGDHVNDQATAVEDRSDNKFVDKEEGEEAELESGEVTDPSSHKVADEKAYRPPPPLLPKGFKAPFIPLHDTKIDSIIEEMKVQQARRKENPDAYPSVDREDAAVIMSRNEKTFEQIVKDKCKQENEGKCRCSYVLCNKLFRGIEFLSKHIKLKHADFAAEELAADAEPFMRSRYDAEDISARHFPFVEVEVQGRTELRSLKEIVDKYAPPPPPPPVGLPPSTRHQGYSSYNHHQGRGGGGGRGGDYYPPTDRNMRDNRNDRRWSVGDIVPSRRGYDDRDRRTSFEGNNNNRSHPPFQQQQQQQQIGDTIQPLFENSGRKISSYIDVDAPKDSSIHIDYGVALLPPVKKRKSLSKKDTV